MPSTPWPVQFDPNQLYFISTCAVKHAHVFRRDDMKRILVDSLNMGRILGQYDLFAFVIMPNHIHFIIQCKNDRTLGDVVGSFKRTTSGLILRQYEAEEEQKMLAFFSAAVKEGRKEEHAVWENEYWPENIYSSRFLYQKMEYIHNNPTQPHWQLVDRPEQYPWSSARFYLLDKRALIPLSDAREVMREWET